jgi:BASS family bile acid:Na+ symporter
MTEGTTFTGTWIVPASMFGLMLGMGLTLTPDDFRRVVRMPRATLVGTFLQLVAMPLAGLAIAHGFALEPFLATGLIIVASCPGGALSNVLCHLFKADTALSITLTATGTAITLFTIPLWVRFAAVAEHSVDMPLLHTALTLGGFTVLPVALGMVLRALRPALAAREPLLTRASTLTMVVAVTVDALTREAPPLAALAASWQPALLLLGAAVVMGVGLPLLLGLDTRDAVTIAVELCIKNGVLGLFVATQSLRSIEAGVPIAAFLTFQLPVGIGVLSLYNAWLRRQPIPEVAS